MSINPDDATALAVTQLEALLSMLPERDRTAVALGVARAANAIAKDAIDKLPIARVEKVRRHKDDDR